MALDSIDWTQPWFAGYQPYGRAVERACTQGMPLHEALNREAAASVRFVPQDELPAGRAYEQYIHESGCCPTRPGLHDFFNGLCWMNFPATKKRLNELQAAQIAGQGIQPVRGAVRDALTIFDENAAFLDAPQALWDALEARDWQRLFIALRPLWAQARLVLFGHALLEKLAHPRKAVTAHVWRLQAGGTMAQVDASVASDLTVDKLAAKPFLPLPVLGVPGWWPANEADGFYDDRQVFRVPAARAAAQPESTAWRRQ